MASQVDVCNMALRKLGQDIGIASLSEQTKTARVLNSLWRMCTDYVFAERLWPFAVKTVDLELQVQNAPTGWQYRYQMPNDSLNLLDVGDALDFELHYYLSLPNTARSQDFTVMHGDQATSILSNAENAKARYVARIEDVGRWPVKFAEAVACKLALESAPAITGNIGLELRDKLFTNYKLAVADATAHDWNESRQTEGYVTPSVAAR